MSEGESRGDDLLRVDADREGEELTVKSNQEFETDELDAYVDDRGIVRYDENGASFNGHIYEVVEE